MKRPKVTDFTETIYRADAYKYTQAQEKYIDYLEEQNQQLTLTDVSQQRELLTEYEKFASGENYINSKPLIDKQIKEFIEVNCG